MKITAILPYFGGKRTLAPRIVAELGPHNAYWEPFCGSLAVLFAKPRSPIETVNDLHGDAINLTMVLASERWPELYEAAGRVLQCERLLRCYRDEIVQACTPAESPADVTAEHVARATAFLALSWIGVNGQAGTRKVNHSYAVRWTQSGGSPNVRWRGVRESIPAWHERLQGVSILHRDAFVVLDRIADETGSVLYIDPPYFRETRGNGGGCRYQHDFDESDHSRLADVLGRFKKARVVVSYYDDPRLAELYDGWTRVDVSTAKLLANATHRAQGELSGRWNRAAPEVLLINGPSLTAVEREGLFAGGVS